jgi:hypothetical protein
MVRMATSRQPRRVVSSHEAKRRRTWSGANPSGKPDQSPACDRWNGREQRLLNDAVEMQEPEEGSKGAPPPDQLGRHQKSAMAPESVPWATNDPPWPQGLLPSKSTGPAMRL